MSSKSYIVIIYEDIDQEDIKEVKHFPYAEPEEVLSFVWGKGFTGALGIRKYRIYKEVGFDIKEEEM